MQRNTFGTMIFLHNIVVMNAVAFEPPQCNFIALHIRPKKYLILIFLRLIFLFFMSGQIFILPEDNFYALLVLSSQRSDSS